MPIYDFDGTTAREIGKIYDNDGTTTRQIGKVYDYNGTTAHLNYTAEEPIYPPASVSGFAGEPGASQGSFYATSINTASTNYAQSYISVNITNYAALVFTSASCSRHQYQSSAIQLRSSPIADDPSAVFSAIHSGTGATRNFSNPSNGSSVDTKTLTSWDVSALSGTYYICCASYNGSSAGGTATATIGTVVGE